MELADAKQTDDINKFKAWLSSPQSREKSVYFVGKVKFLRSWDDDGFYQYHRIEGELKTTIVNLNPDFDIFQRRTPDLIPPKEISELEKLFRD